ncbi:glycosyl hydrolase family 28-related protein [Schlesneria paludicola]|uniref:glycosyl hydrolase family 28-related protein n=1 Tax=Schlesneria paludicola TaxID=360056 RepID=UPI00029A8C1F|nr:glycosyl hydrolase family 28-related protein [Schlesneria paludicola]
MSRFLGSLALIGVVAIVGLGSGYSIRPIRGQAEKRLTDGRVSVLDFGAVGDGKTDDRAAIQAALDAGEEIHFPDVRAFYHVEGALQIGGQNKFGAKRLIGHRPCRGGGAFKGKPPLMQGDGSAPLLLAVGSTNQNRAIELTGLSASNPAAPVLELRSGIDAIVDNCWFSSQRNQDATVKLRESYGVTIRESTINCSGGGFAVTAYQQCNALRIQQCRLGGGDLGGAAHVEQSANVQLANNIVELGVYGLVVSSGIRLDQPESGHVEGAGVCHALRVTGNYFENVQHPLVIATAMNIENHPGQAVFGAVIESNHMSQRSFDFPLLTIGRLRAATIQGNSFWRKSDSKAPAIYATYTRGATPAYPAGCVIEANHLTNGSGAFFLGEDVRLKGETLSQILQTENRVAAPHP